MYNICNDYEGTSWFVYMYINPALAVFVAKYYVTWGGHATDAAPGAPMPTHGKALGKIAAADFKGLVEKGLVQYGKYNSNMKHRPD